MAWYNQPRYKPNFPEYSSYNNKGSILLTWFNFNPSMDK